MPQVPLHHFCISVRCFLVWYQYTDSNYSNSANASDWSNLSRRKLLSTLQSIQGCTTLAIFTMLGEEPFLKEVGRLQRVQRQIQIKPSSPAPMQLFTVGSSSCTWYYILCMSCIHQWTMVTQPDKISSMLQEHFLKAENCTGKKFSCFLSAHYSDVSICY